MGKKKIDEDLSVTDESPLTKKHKKHKKHKHKKKRDNESLLSSPEDPNKPSIKLKIKIGGQTVEHVENVVEDQGGPSSELGLIPQVPFVKKVVVEEDEEEAWLKALEAGTLDDNGEVKRKKDPNLMTARQRALVFGVSEESLQQLPTGYKSEQLTEEQIQRRLLKAKKRKQQAHEKREKDKKQTIDRLLKKQDTKTRGNKIRGRKDMPMFRYILSQNTATICVPQGFNFPFTPQKARPPPEVKYCGRPGCSNPKKYNCSKTGVPLCGLECYKINLRNRSSLTT